MLPNDFPPYPTVWSFFRRANQTGLWDYILQEVGRKSTPTYAIIDSKSVRTIYASEDRGIDGGKKIKGRKRHIIVDTLGNLLAVKVHAGNIHDTKAGINVVNRAMKNYPTIQAISADADYRTTFEADVWEQFTIPVDISLKITGEWRIIPKR